METILRLKTILLSTIISFFVCFNSYADRHDEDLPIEVLQKKHEEIRKKYLDAINHKLDTLIEDRDDAIGRCSIFSTAQRDSIDLYDGSLSKLQRINFIENLVTNYYRCIGMYVNTIDNDAVFRKIFYISDNPHLAKSLEELIEAKSKYENFLIGFKNHYPELQQYILTHILPTYSDKKLEDLFAE